LDIYYATVTAAILGDSSSFGDQGTTNTVDRNAVLLEPAQSLSGVARETPGLQQDMASH
jgi:hypothetical protein